MDEASTHWAPAPSGSLRWSGLLLACSGIALFVSIGLYGAIYGGVTASDPDVGVTIADRARHVLTHWGPLSTIWLVETVAYFTLSVAALVRIPEQRLAAGRLPVSLGWSAVAAASLLQTAMYAFMLGGYPASAAVATEQPAIFAAMNDAAVFLFDLSNAGLLAGLAVVFFAEGTDGGVLPPTVARVMGGALVIAFFLFVGYAAGALSLAAVAPFALATQLLIAWLGLRLWRT